MGGYSSGRYRTRNRGTMESALRIDVRTLRRLGFLKEGAVTNGPLNWTRGGKPSGSVRCIVNLATADNRHMTISYRLNDRQDVAAHIGIVGVPMRFGGLRYYALCPKCWGRCEVLPIVADKVACRKCQRLSYESQSEDRLRRLRSKADRLYHRIFDGPRRLRGENRKRVVERWTDADVAFEEGFGRMAGKWLARIRKLETSFP